MVEYQYHAEYGFPLPRRLMLIFASIVFVHGISGSPSHVWTTWEDSAWLQDCIPSLNRVRIIPWTCDIRCCDQDLFDRAAENLLHDLKDDSDAVKKTIASYFSLTDLE